MKNKVLFICFDGLISDLGSSQVIPYCKLIKNFSNLKICSLEKTSRIIESNKKIFFVDKTCEFDIYDESKNSVIRFLKNFYKLYILSSKLILKERPNFIHCRSYIPMAILCLFKLNRKCNFKIIFDIRGFFFSERLENINNKYISIFLKPIFNLLEKYLFNNSNLIITLTKSSIPRIKTIIGNINKPIFVIPTVTSGKEKNKPTNSKKEYDFIYLGSANKPYCLDDAIKLVGNLNRYKKKDYSLLVITRSNITPFKKLACRYGLEKNIKFITVDHKNVFSYIAKCKCGLVFLESGTSRLAQFPTKVGEILSQSVPICTNHNLPEIANLIKEFDAGKVIKNLPSKESYDDFIHLFENYEFFSKNAFNLWKSKLSTKVAFKYYKEIYS